MKDFIKERIASCNGVALNNKMLKKAEEYETKRKNALMRELTKAYNFYSREMPPITEFDVVNKLRQDSMNAMKYGMYYEDLSYW